MDRSYIDILSNQAICCWNAPDKKAVEDLFQKAGIKPESIREVVVHPG
jgi:hypothetical protein